MFYPTSCNKGSRAMRTRQILTASVLVLMIGEKGQGDYILTGTEHLDVTSSHSMGVQWDSSTVDVLGGGRIQDAYVNDEALLQMLGGRISNVLYTYDTSRVDISNGNLYTLRAHNNSSVEMAGGTLTGRLHANNASHADISGGSVANLFAYGTSHVDMSGGDIAYRLWAEDSSTVGITGGTLGEIETYNGSSVDISGGRIRLRLETYDASNVDISGGKVGDVYAYESSSITFHGYDFRTTGGLTLQGETVLGRGLLSGKWFDGTPWAVTIEQHDTSATIRAVVPEPSAVVLMGMAAVVSSIVAWRKHNRNRATGIVCR